MALASVLAMRLLSTVSLVETLVEFTYVMRSLDRFTPFERIFFLSAGVSEMAGEVLLAVLMVRWLHKRRLAGLRDTEQRLSVGDAREHLERLSQDPINALKNISEEYFGASEVRPDGLWSRMSDRREDAIDEQKHRLAMMLQIFVSLCVTCSPTLAFGVGLVISRGVYDFQSPGDEAVMFSLAAISLVALAAFGAFVWCVCLLGRETLCRKGELLLRGDSSSDLVFFNDKFIRGLLRWAVAGGAVIYSVEKLFEVYLLISRSDRLVTDALAESLVVFQLIELVSVVSIVYLIVLDYYFGDTPPEPTQLERMEMLLEDVAGGTREMDTMRAINEQLVLVPTTCRLASLGKRRAHVAERIERLQKLREEIEIEMEQLEDAGSSVLQGTAAIAAAVAAEYSTVVKNKLP